MNKAPTSWTPHSHWEAHTKQTNPYCQRADGKCRGAACTQLRRDGQGGAFGRGHWIQDQEKVGREPVRWSWGDHVWGAQSRDTRVAANMAQEEQGQLWGAPEGPREESEGDRKTLSI